MRERDQANHNTMQIRSDFEKLLLQSNQVKQFLSQRTKQNKQISGFTSTSSSTQFNTKSFE